MLSSDRLQCVCQHDFSDDITSCVRVFKKIDAPIEAEEVMSEWDVFSIAAAGIQSDHIRSYGFQKPRNDRPRFVPRGGEMVGNFIVNFVYVIRFK